MMKNKTLYLLSGLLISFLFSCQSKEKNSEEWMKNPQHQEEAMQYIMNDYALMMEFLDRCMSNEQAQSMMLGHRNMMAAMLSNTELMTEVMRSDTIVCDNILRDMMQTVHNDSMVYQRMQHIMHEDSKLDKMNPERHQMMDGHMH